MPDPASATTGPSSEGGRPEPLFGGRIPLRAGGMRVQTARGTLVNAAFQIGLVTVGLLKGVVVAAFLTRSEYGVWGILTITLMTFLWLRQVGISDKYVQQDEPDQRLAFQRAFTFELVFSSGVAVLFAAALPGFALVYGEWEIVAPGLAMAAMLPLGAAQAPSWVFYRRMEFVKQRLVQAVDPVVGLVVTVLLAIGGFGYWSLVLGAVAGTLAGALVAVLVSPYPLALRYEGRQARDYVSFSWPLVVAGSASLVIAQGSIIAGEATLGLAGAGAIALAATVAHYSDRVDAVLTATIYPAICAVRDSTDLLHETFVKSNRLALMWGLPFGVGLSLFAADLVNHVLGPEWQPAIVLLQVFGLTAAAGHIGFNWDAFYRARGNTRPIAVWSVCAMLAFLAMPLPLLLSGSLRGFALGIGAMTLVSLAVKGYYLTRLFDGFDMLRHALRALAPTVPAVAAVLLVRALESGSRGGADTALELALYLAVTVVVTVALERRLLGEVLGYLRADPAPPTAPSAV